MKVEIEEINNGYVVKYADNHYTKEFTYVFRSVDDLIMLEDFAKRFLKRRIKIEEK